MTELPDDQAEHTASFKEYESKSGLEKAEMPIREREKIRAGVLLEAYCNLFGFPWKPAKNMIAAIVERVFAQYLWILDIDKDGKHDPILQYTTWFSRDLTDNKMPVWTSVDFTATIDDDSSETGKVT